MKHKHYWSYIHTIWQGRNKRPAGEVGITRYCSECGLTQAAFTSNWKAIPKGYVDMKQECESQMSEDMVD